MIKTLPLQIANYNTQSVAPFWKNPTECTERNILQFDLLMSCSVEQSLVLNQVLLFLDPGVCLVESESGRNTSAVGGPNVDGSYDYGLFQVSSIFSYQRTGPPNGHSLMHEY